MLKNLVLLVHTNKQESNRISDANLTKYERTSAIKHL